MPTYEYECKSCGYTFETFQSMSDVPLRECPQCGKEIRRLIFGGTGVIFKGSGFYVTDKSRGPSTTAPAKTSKTAESSPGSAVESPPKKGEASNSPSGGGSSETKEKAAAPQPA